MTKAELSKLHYLNKDIERERRQLAELRARGTSVTAQVSGLPHVGGAYDKIGEHAIEMADLEALIDIHIRQSVAEYKRLNQYIQEVIDPQMRTILSLRYINGMSWRQIAFSIGGGNTEDSTKKMAYRYIEKN